MSKLYIAGQGFNIETVGAGTPDLPAIIMTAMTGNSDGTAPNTVARIADVFTDLNAVTITTTTSIWSPSNKKFRLMGGTISVSAAASVLFTGLDGVNVYTVYRTPVLAANTPYTFVVGNNGIVAPAINNELRAISSAAATITGTLWGTEE